MKRQPLRKLFSENKQILYFLLFILAEILYFLTQLYGGEYHVIHTRLDDFIPFLPVFVIPYVIWYLYVPFSMLYTCFTDKSAFKKQIITVFSGMAVCIATFIVFPTSIDFRPNAEGNGFFLWICRIIFSKDKPVNVFPSMHCYEAVIIHLTTFRSTPLKKNIPLRASSAVLAVLICLSTVFIKQHSVIDLFGGVALAVILYAAVYVIPWKSIHKPKKTRNDA